jgi:hypothetical protein
LLAGENAALMISETPSPVVLQGTKSLLMAGWFNDASVSIAQQGDVPLGTQSLRFLARNTEQNDLLAGPFDLRMDGQSVPLVILASESRDFLYGGDISAWAGSTSEMRIVITTYGVPGYTGFAFVDAIEFSPLPIPESTALALVCLGGLGILRRRR